MFLFIVAIQRGEDHLHLASLKNAQKAVCEDLSVQTVINNALKNLVRQLTLTAVDASP